MLTREMRRQALAPFRDEWSMRGCDGDAWGATLGHWFGVADVLYHADADLPGKWQFHHGAADHDPIGDFHAWDQPCSLRECNAYCRDGEHDCCQCQEERHYVPFLDAGETGIEMLTYAGNVLDRYAGWLKRAGKDY